MHRCGFTFFLGKDNTVLNALPFLGATIGLGAVIGTASPDYVGSPSSMAILIGAEIVCALIFALGLTPQKTFRTTYSLPRSAQYGIYMSGLLVTTTVMFLSGINLSVWSDIQNSRLPNRSTAMASVSTQRFLFGDRTALRLIWSLYENASNCRSYDSMKFYQDQAERFCMTIQGLNYTRQELTDGTRIHNFNNSAMGVSGSGFVHQNGEIVYFTDNGIVDFANGFFGVQPISLGESIKTINVLEKPDGTKEYRFNGATEPQIVFSKLNNSTKTHLSNGDTINEFDVTNLASFDLLDGVNLYFTNTESRPHQQVMVGLPIGCAADLEFEAVASRARVIQHKDASPTQLILMDDFFQPSHELKIPSNIVPSLQRQIDSPTKAKLLDHPRVQEWCDSLLKQMPTPLPNDMTDEEVAQYYGSQK